MRADMKHVIAKGHHSGERYDGKRHTRADSLEKLENLPEKESMRTRWAGWHSPRGPNCRPMIRFLRSRVGQPWDDVFSEICKNAGGGRRGRDMHKAVEWVVETNINEVTRRLYWSSRGEFYVDKDGVLCEQAPYKRWRKRNQEPDPDKFNIRDRCFERINGCWFEVWYEIADKQHWRRCPMSGEQYIVYCKGEYIAHKKQLSKKEMKAIKVSNDPEYVWWKK